MAYSKSLKNEILTYIKSGLTLTDLAKTYKINISTLCRWKKTIAEFSDKQTIKNIQKQLNTLSKQKPSHATAKKIAMLTSAMTKLQREQTRKKKIRKPRPRALLDKNAHELKKQAIEDGGIFGKLFKYQEDFLNDDSQFRLILKARQVGFSYVSALDALLGAISGRNQLFLSASEEQAFILMRYLEAWAKRLEITFKKDASDEKTLDNDVYIKVLAHNFRTAQGFTGDIWLDEFAWYPNPKKMWHAFIPSIGAVKGRLTILSTPFEEHSLFYDLWHNEDKYYMFKKHKIDIYKAMKHGLEFDLETMKSLFDVDTWASAYECQFIDDESALLSIKLIKDCVKDYIPTIDDPAAPLYCGYDIGRTKDRSVLIATKINVKNEKKTNLIARMEVLVKASFENQENHLKSFMNLYPNSMIKIDKTGMGMGTSEKIKSKFKSRAKGVWFTATNKETMALNLKKHFEDKLIQIPNDPALIADLHAIKRKAGTKSFLYDSDRNEHGHADRFWALALALSYHEKIRNKKNKAWVI